MGGLNFYWRNSVMRRKGGGSGSPGEDTVTSDGNGVRGFGVMPPKIDE